MKHLIFLFPLLFLFSCDARKEVPAIQVIKPVAGSYDVKMPNGNTVRIGNKFTDYVGGGAECSLTIAPAQVKANGMIQEFKEGNYPDWNDYILQTEASASVEPIAVTSKPTYIQTVTPKSFLWVKPSDLNDVNEIYLRFTPVTHPLENGLYAAKSLFYGTVLIAKQDRGGYGIYYSISTNDNTFTTQRLDDAGPFQGDFIRIQ
ncbi:MAG: hypothetical protein HC874_14335 [Richelia sp. SL_2_1]|nr:hypothetical protein [Richelia sp. SL_2_1]